jgi:hypothetical protein
LTAWRNILQQLMVGGCCRDIGHVVLRRVAEREIREIRSVNSVNFPPHRLPNSEFAGDQGW